MLERRLSIEVRQASGDVGIVLNFYNGPYDGVIIDEETSTQRNQN